MRMTYKNAMTGIFFFFTKSCNIYKSIINAPIKVQATSTILPTLADIAVNRTEGGLKRDARIAEIFCPLGLAGPILYMY